MGDLGEDFCHTLHIMDSRGESVVVNKKCADSSECSPQRVGCLSIDTQTVSFLKGKDTRDASELLATIGERENKDVCIVFVYVEKAFEKGDWNKLMGILKKIGVD
ncbi:hypothetical protein ANN_08359 [Periplaneta americana]|uniref:Uncharacterized protein n=1 Tax=Periplaneta americana TaxID=6978 RepID=A0ABQ8T3F7_PERAM|nr:hypothetical protein ANN_08359 [Periplaneta americana]